MNYEELFDKFPRYRELKDIKPLKTLYRKLSAKESVEKMAVAGDIAGRPAICGVVRFIEKYCERHAAERMGLEGNHGLFVRRFIGAMINDIMIKNGYHQAGKQKIIGGKLSKYFLSGACYEKSQENDTVRPARRRGAKHANIPAAAGERDTRSRDLINGLDLASLIKEAFCTAAENTVKSAERGNFENDGVFLCGGEIINYPFADLIFSHPRCLYMTAGQIAAEIDRNHPGLLEMTGLFFMPEIPEETDDEKSAGGRRNPVQQMNFDLFHGERILKESFVELIENYLVREIESQNRSEIHSRFEMVSFSGLYEPEITVFHNCEFVSYPPELPVRLFRLFVPPAHDLPLIDKLSERAAMIDTRYSAQFFDKYKLPAMIREALCGTAGFHGKRARAVGFMTFNQLKKTLFDVAAGPGGELRFNVPYNFDGYPVYAILLELLKRKLPDFSIRFMSPRHLAGLWLSKYYEIENDDGTPVEDGDAAGLNDLGNYIPLIGLNPDADVLFGNV